MLIECNICESRVDARILKSHESYDPETDPSPFRATLLECPGCKNSLLVGQYHEGTDPNGDAIWDNPARVWPAPDRYVSWEIPAIVRVSLEEAEQAFKGKAYTACAVMCGRALEGICRHYKTRSQYLGGGLKELANNKIIDGRLMEWSDALRAQRNAAAHASTVKVSRADASDLLDFVHAITEYVFVLTKKYEKFKERAARSKKKSK